MFGLFEKKPTLSEEAKRLNRLWDKYASGRLEEENYALFVLCDYDGGVNGEGHSGFFANNEDNLDEITAELEMLLPEELLQNYLKALKAYGTETEDEISDQADEFFYAHENEITAILQNAADSME